MSGSAFSSSWAVWAPRAAARSATRWARPGPGSADGVVGRVEERVEAGVLGLHLAQQRGVVGAVGHRTRPRRRGGQRGVLDGVVDPELALEVAPCRPGTAGCRYWPAVSGLAEPEEIAAEGVVGDVHEGEVDVRSRGCCPGGWPW